MSQRPTSQLFIQLIPTNCSLDITHTMRFSLRFCFSLSLLLTSAAMQTARSEGSKCKRARARALIHLRYYHNRDFSHGEVSLLDASRNMHPRLARALHIYKADLFSPNGNRCPRITGRAGPLPVNQLSLPLSETARTSSAPYLFIRLRARRRPSASTERGQTYTCSGVANENPRDHRDDRSPRLAVVHGTTFVAEYY